MMDTGNPLADDLEFILERTRDLWEELRGERIFITGGTGFFGCWILETFAWANARLKLGAHAVVLTRDPDSFGSKAPHLAGDVAITCHRGDVKNFCFPSGSFSHVLHAATEATPWLNQSAPLAMLDGIVEGTRHTLDCALACGARKFLLTSSGAVYGPQPPELRHVPEDFRGAPSPVDGNATYGEGKRVAELLCALYAANRLEVKIARCFAFVGPYLPLDAHYAVGNFIRDALNGDPVIVRGDGTPHRSYLYASDLAIALWGILFKGKSCRPYNVGSSEEVTIRELASEVAAVIRPGLDVRVLREPVIGAAAERYVPLVERISLDLGIRQSVSLREGIRRTAAWNTTMNCFREGRQ